MYGAETMTTYILSYVRACNSHIMHEVDCADITRYLPMSCCFEENSCEKSRRCNL